MKFVSIGADPEFFFFRDRKPLPAVGLLGGTKEEPRRLTDGDNPYYIQEDNVMGELNLPVITNADDWNTAFDTTRQLIGQLSDSIQAKPAYVPSLTFPSSALQTEQARMFGCSPDRNAWTNEVNKVVDPDVVGPQRFAGGHVHIAYSDAENPNKEVSDVLLARMCDVFLGIPSVLLDKDNKRRRLYGRAGNYRSKDYGIEYRTLSNFWLRDRQTWNWVYNQVQLAVKYAENFEEILNTGIMPRQITFGIDNSNKYFVDTIIKSVGIRLP